MTELLTKYIHASQQSITYIHEAFMQEMKIFPYK